MQLPSIRRGHAVVFALACALLVATACGEDGGGAGGAAAGGGALEHVPQDTVMYAVLDTNFDGEAWQQAQEHARQFDGYEQARDKWIAKTFEGEDVKWEDIKPWLGDSAGAATWPAESASDGKQPAAETQMDEMPSSPPDGELPSAPQSDAESDMDAVAWAQVSDRSKAEKFIEDRQHTKEGEQGDFTLYEMRVEEGEPSQVALSDELMLVAEERKALEKSIKAKDGKSVLDDEGTQRAAQEIGDDALLATVVSGEGARSAAAENEMNSEQLKQLLEIDEVAAFQGLSLSIHSNEDGFYGRGHVAFDEEKLGKDGLDVEQFEPSLLRDLPAETLVAVTGHDLGGMIRRTAASIADNSEEAAEQIAQAEAVSGVELADLEKAWGDQFAIAVAPPAGAGTADDPAAAVPSVSVVLEESDKAAAEDVTEKLVGLTGLQGTRPKDVEVDGVDAKEASLGFTTVLAAFDVDGRSIFTNDRDILSAIGKGDTLGEAEGFEQAWNDADAPDEVAAAAFVDVPRVLEIARAMGQDEDRELDALGEFVGWMNVEDDSLTFEFFVRVREDSDATSTDEG